MYAKKYFLLKIVTLKDNTLILMMLPLFGKYFLNSNVEVYSDLKLKSLNWYVCMYEFHPS